jgi:thioredoxin
MDNRKRSYETNSNGSAGKTAKSFKRNLNNSNKGKTMAEHLTKQAFLEKVFNYEKNQDWKFEGELPAVVDFWAPWCGPCRTVGPIIDELSTEYKGKVNFYKVNTDEEQELGAVFGIRSIPSLLFIPKDGQPKLAVGALPKESFKSAIEKELLISEPSKN